MQNAKIAADRFDLRGKAINIDRYGFGHINKTFLITCDSGTQYIMQQINAEVFRDIPQLMENISRVTAHIRRQLLETGGDPERQGLTLIPTRDGADYCRLADGFWRCYLYIRDSVAMQTAATPHDFMNSALAFGAFRKALRDFPAETLHETIPNFHNTPVRYANLQAAVKQDAFNRAAGVEKEIAFARNRSNFAGILQNLIQTGQLTLSVTHNDTKLNNVLFDKDTLAPLAVIDLDTVMPGLSLYDFGDSIRFGATRAAEDEKNLRKVNFELDLFSAYVHGYLKACGDTLTPLEISLMPEAARLMTFECGMRFLTDYLQGDTYFATTYPGQNLDRCRTQFMLVREMENKKEAMQIIVKEQQHVLL